MVSYFNMIKAIVVRFLFVFHVILTTWRVTVNLKDQKYWLLLCILLALGLEGCYTIIQRHGREFSRFTPCFFFYLGAVLPGIWLLELDRTDRYIQGKDVKLVSDLDPANYTVPGLNHSIWLVVIEEMMPYVIFISRWILPRGSITRFELAELLFSFIDLGADIMEFFSLFDENIVRGSRPLSYAVLSIWSLSVMQFTTTFTVIHSPKNVNADGNMTDLPEKEKEWLESKHEIYAIFVSMGMQDLPFAIMRLYVIINFNRINYSLIFFTSKNLLIIVLLLYKVIVLCKKRHCPGPEDDDYDESAEKIVGGGPGADEIEVSNVQRTSNLKGGLSHLITRRDKTAAPLDDSIIQRSHYLLNNETELKKRNGKTEKPSHRISSNESLPHLNKDNVIEPVPITAHELQKTIQDQQEADFAPALYHSFAAPDQLNPRFTDNKISRASKHSHNENSMGNPKRTVKNPTDPTKELQEESERHTKPNSRRHRQPKEDHGSQVDETSNHSGNSERSELSLISQTETKRPRHVQEEKVPTSPHHLVSVPPQDICTTPRKEITDMPETWPLQLTRDDKDGNHVKPILPRGPYVSVIRLLVIDS